MSLITDFDLHPAVLKQEQEEEKEPQLTFKGGRLEKISKRPQTGRFRYANLKKPLCLLPSPKLPTNSEQPLSAKQIDQINTAPIPPPQIPPVEKNKKTVEGEILIIKYEEDKNKEKYKNIKEYTTKTIKNLKINHKGLYKYIESKQLIDSLSKELLTGETLYNSLSFLIYIEIIKNNYTNFYEDLKTKLRLSDKQIFDLVKEAESNFKITDFEFQSKIEKSINKININEMRNNLFRSIEKFEELNSDEVIRKFEKIIKLLEIDYEFSFHDLDIPQKEVIDFAFILEGCLNELPRDFHREYFYRILPQAIRTCLEIRSNPNLRQKLREILKKYAISRLNQLVDSPEHRGFDPKKVDLQIAEDLDSPLVTDGEGRKHISKFFQVNYMRIANTKFVNHKGEIKTITKNTPDVDLLKKRDTIVALLENLSDGDQNCFLFLEILLSPEHDLDSSAIVLGPWSQEEYASLHFVSTGSVIEREFVKQKNENGLILITGTYFLDISLSDLNKSQIVTRKISVTFDFSRDAEGNWHRSPPEYQPLEVESDPSSQIEEEKE